VIRFALTAACALGLSACSQADAPEAPEALPVAAAPETPPLDASEITAIDAINACYVTAAQVSEAMGGSFSEGVASPALGQMRGCSYNSRENQLRVNVVWIDPAQVNAWRAAMQRPLAGAVTPIAGDPNGAIFQMQADIGTCAISFVRGNLQYELRAMTCRGAPDEERARLLRLPRPS